MGLLDSVIGGVLGSQGQSGGGSSGTSPMVKALMLLLAAKAATSYMHRGDGAPASTGSTPPAPPTSTSGSIDSGMMAGLPSLDSILGKFRSAGHEQKVDSWIGGGQNQPIHPHEIESTLGSETVGQLQTQTGLPKDQLLQQLSQYLPQIIDKLSPGGKLPGPTERSHW